MIKAFVYALLHKKRGKNHAINILGADMFAAIL